ncbi:MAG: hypothetical protein H7Y86_18385 [Rhizobacter sp.]|nr:hypothetical protein [Ferruginibacter sp.]
MKSLFFCLLGLGFLFTACTSDESKDKKIADKYEDTKLSLEEIEKKSPENFISVKGTDKKNLLGQTVVRGKIQNNAKMATFKDIDVKLFFYSKTGVLLQEDQEMIYESVAPGESKSFKSKYFAPKGTDSIAMKVVSAKF